LGIPDVLTSGHHAKVDEWRRQQAIKRTWENRPDLLQTADLSADDKRYLAQLMDEAKRDEE
jgi:tRNA (guanine37-N1)-methyltransferase